MTVAQMQNSTFRSQSLRGTCRMELCSNDSDEDYVAVEPRMYYTYKLSFYSLSLYTSVDYAYWIFVRQFGVAVALPYAYSFRLVLQLWHNERYIVANILSLANYFYNSIEVYEICQLIQAADVYLFEQYKQHGEISLRRMREYNCAIFNPNSNSQAFDGAFFNCPVTLSNFKRSITLYFDYSSLAVFMQTMHTLTTHLQSNKMRLFRPTIGSLSASCPHYNLELFLQPQSYVASPTAASMHASQNCTRRSQSVVVSDDYEYKGICLRHHKLSKIIFKRAIQRYRPYLKFRYNEKQEWINKHIKTVSSRQEPEEEAIKLFNYKYVDAKKYYRTLYFVFDDGDLMVYLKAEEYMLAQQIINMFNHCREYRRSISQASHTQARSEIAVGVLPLRGSGVYNIGNRTYSRAQNINARSSLHATSNDALDVYELSHSQLRAISVSQDRKHSSRVSTRPRAKSATTYGYQWYSGFYYKSGYFVKAELSLVRGDLNVRIEGGYPQYLTILGVYKQKKLNPTQRDVSRYFIREQKQLRRDALKSRSLGTTVSVPYTELVTLLSYQNGIVILAMRPQQSKEFLEALAIQLKRNKLRAQRAASVECADK